MAKSALPTLIRRLLDTRVYPHPVEKVELVQTHISYVFLAGNHVYKIKKPVNFGFLDFSTPRKRLYYCQQEVALNQRLCPGFYLGVVRLDDSGGRIAFNGRGRLLDYAVHMRRLPAEGMMDCLLESGEVTVAMVEDLADRLAHFHSQAETNQRIARYGARAIRRAWRENFEQWAPYIGRTVTAEEDRLLREYVYSFFRRQRDLLARRAEQLRICDCHGDLRSDAVCFIDLPAGRHVCIFDCIEFNRRFRYTDVAGDVGFLAMDLDYRGRPDLSRAFVERYLAVSGDRDLPSLISFYKCYRAAVRGKVEGFRSNQAEVSSKDRARALKAARRYFDLACRYAAADRPLLVITCGLTGTGKSTLARHLAEGAGLALVSSDVVRKQLAGLSPQEQSFEPFRRGIYSRAFTDKTYEALFQAAQTHLRQGQGVVLDASFVQRKYRLWARRLAASEGAAFYCLEARASDAAVRRRLARRLREGGDPSDARWEIYVDLKQAFQAVTELPAERHIVIDSSRPIEDALTTVRRRIRR
jgi:aminoglycoside phosphotransferase family enzyme/cytidylate kinase